MRLLFAHEKFGSFAGAESNAWHTAAALKRRGHVVGLLHGPATGQGEDAWREVFDPRFSLDPEPVAAVAAAVAAFGPEAIYVHNLGGSAVTETLLGTGVPLVRMIHDHQLTCMRGYKYHVLNRWICTRAFSPFCLFPCGASLARDREGFLPVKWVGYGEHKRTLELHRHFHRLIVASAYMQDELIRNGFDPARIEIHPPVPPPAGVRAGATFGPRNLLVYAGQIARGKGVDVLLEALALVRVPFECAILGDGHHRPYCERLCRELGLTDRVHFHGYLPQARVAEYYRDASAAVLSSVWPEPFGAVGLEAMHHGLPVVAFDAGAIREWLRDGENGLLAPWMDREGFARRIEFLLLDKARARRLGERARELVARQYDFSRYIDGIENLLARVRTGSPASA